VFSFITACRYNALSGELNGKGGEEGGRVSSGAPVQRGAFHVGRAAKADAVQTACGQAGAAPVRCAHPACLLLCTTETKGVKL